MRDAAAEVGLDSRPDPTMRRIPDVIAGERRVPPGAQRPAAREKDLLVAVRGGCCSPMDDCEQLVEPCEEVADGMLPACPRMRLLVTSREARRQGEQVMLPPGERTRRKWPCLFSCPPLACIVAGVDRGCIWGVVPCSSWGRVISVVAAGGDRRTRVRAWCGWRVFAHRRLEGAELSCWSFSMSRRRRSPQPAS